MLRLAFRFTGNNEDALDVLQETFTYLIGKFPSFVLTSSMTTFLFPVVRNRSLQLRRKRRRSQSPEGLQEMPGFVPVDLDQTRAELSAAMANLPVEQREAVLLRFVDDLTIDEIAAATAVPAGTVKSRLHNALSALREDPRIRRYFS